MIRDEAEKLCGALQGCFGGPGAEVVAAVEPQSTRIEFTAPGGARPHIIRYKIRISGPGRVARLELAEAETLLDRLSAGPRDDTPDTVFAEIAAAGLAVEAQG